MILMNSHVFYSIKGDKSKGYYRFLDLLKIVLLSFMVNLILTVFIGINQPEYFWDYRRNGNPDARDYVRLGENFWLSGKYSRQAAPPYQPDILRTPVYPILAGGINVLSG